MLNDIYWRLRTGSPWDEIPERYGPPTTCSNRFWRWAKIGVWDRVSGAVSRACDGDIQMLDATSVRVRQHGGNFAKGGLRAAGRRSDAARAQCMGRSRGGLTTKIHALCDADGLPIAVKIT